MIDKYEVKQVKLNFPLKGHKKGTKVPIEFSGDIPKDKYWRDRFKDAKIDNCVEMADAKGPRKQNKEKVKNVDR